MRLNQNGSGVFNKHMNITSSGAKSGCWVDKLPPTPSNPTALFVCIVPLPNLQAISCQYHGDANPQYKRHNKNNVYYVTNLCWTVNDAFMYLTNTFHADIKGVKCILCYHTIFSINPTCCPSNDPHSVRMARLRRGPKIEISPTQDPT